MALIGTLVIWAGLALSLLSIGLYVWAPGCAQWGRRAYLLGAGCVVAAAFVLQLLLQQHRFDIGYVYHYSARDINPFYLFATFWAGQEGSFLLWAFWIAILGSILIFNCGPMMERRVMPIYGVILAFLMVILTVKSPFALAPKPMQSDGMGLQPLLENPWMVIHPPTLFLGFSLSAPPFAFCLAALANREEEAWRRRAWPWALLCFGILGFGIMLGGYWAYETLGWGGFWGWDPVENGPLVPWLLMGGFIHTVQAQRMRPVPSRSTYVFGALPFLATLYETFLTRTGILSNFSNHSFSTLGGVANGIILWSMLGAIAITVWLIGARGGEAGATAARDTPASRQFALALAAIIMAVCALITGVGMSAPLITGVGVKLGWIAHQSSVAVDYYDKANFPIAILLGFGMAIGPYLAWNSTALRQIRGLPTAWALAVFLTIALYWIGDASGVAHFNAPMVLLMASSLFAVSAGVQALHRRLRASLRSLSAAGGLVAHIGAGLLLLGVVSLVCLQKVEDVQLVQDHPAAMRTLPYAVTYLGMTSSLKNKHNLLRFRVERIDREGRDHEAFNVAMPCAIRKQETASVLLARPAIRHHLWGDLYFALKAGPEQVSPSELVRFTLAKGASKTIEGYTYTFRSFHVPADVAADVTQGIMPDRFPVTALVDVKSPCGQTARLQPGNIRDRNDPLGPDTPEYRLPRPERGTWWGITFEAMNADTGDASFFVRDLSRAPLTRYTIEISTRPLIWLVWIGTVILTAGALLAARRRAIEQGCRRG